MQVRPNIAALVSQTNCISGGSLFLRVASLCCRATNAHVFVLVVFCFLTLLIG